MTDTPATGYIAYPLEQDTEAIAQAAYDYIQAQIPGWEPAAGNLEVILIEAIAQQASEVAEVAATVPDAIFRYFGQSLLGIAPKDAGASSAFATWTVTDTDGYVIPAGTQVAIGTTAFENVAEITIANGDTEALLVEMVAVEAGVEANGLTGATDLLDALSYLASVELSSVSSGGVDAETDDEYLDRLAAVLQTLSPRPIVPNDFALLAQQIDGVHRAVAIDLLDPITPDTSAPRSVTIAAVDVDGVGVGATIRTNIDEALQAAREINFQVFVIQPTSTSVDVDVSYVILDGYDADDVEGAVITAVEDYLSPANWGLSPGGESVSWTNSAIVRYLEVAAVINQVAGVDYIDTLQLDGDPYGDDVALSGYAPLPAAGAITATAV